MNARHITSLVAGATLAVALAQGSALAIPGGSVTQFQAWAKSNPALHELSKQQTNQDTGQPYYSANFQVGSTPGKFLANVGDGNRISSESVAVATDDESFDILKHTDVELAMIAAVYGPAVQDDFKSATLVGRWQLKGQTHATALDRGKLYGYEATLFSVQLIPASRITSESKRLAGCVKTDCNED